MIHYLKLRELRSAKGMTQKELADILDVSETTIFKYEKGIMKPSLERAMQLADALECSLDDLVDMQAYIYNLYNKNK